MSKKLFWTNPYQRTLETSIASVSGSDIILSETIFFAFAGGQESDTGSIAGQTVLSAARDGLEIIYTLPETHGLMAGQRVQVDIDWERRYRLMRLHFAAELVLELFYKNLPEVNKVGAHITQDKARIDFAWPESIAPQLPAIASAANTIISANLPIKTGFDDEENERRYWEIEGFSRIPCGGTHVRLTGEIGPIRLKRNNRGRGNERVEIYLAS